MNIQTHLKIMTNTMHYICDDINFKKSLLKLTKN